MGPTNHVSDGDRDPPQKGAIFGGRAAHSKALAVSATVFAAKKIIQYAGKSEVGSCQVGVTLNFLCREKNPPLRCGLSSKFFDHDLFIILFQQY